MDDLEPFDICGPLPGPGITVLEASAGTGKTFAITALTARLVGEGVPLERILAVTFTRMATAELRDRVRSQLVTVEQGLRRVLDGGVPPPPEDRLLAVMATGGRVQVEDRRRHLADALAGFDAATIATTHGFCQLALAGLGVSGRVGVGAVLVEDAQDTVDECVDDLFADRVLRWGKAAFTLADARMVAAKAVANPDTPLLPEASDSPAGRRRRFADKVREEVRRRLLEANLLTFDGLLVCLRDALADPVRGEEVRRLLRKNYDAVLVDEFQDTDPVQWEVVRRAFGGGTTTLVLIGDPKQAIYAFRGADVYAYLDASAIADRRFTLSENWRSDQHLIDALDALLDPLHVGHPGIVYRRVVASAAHQGPGLQGAPAGAPLRVRVARSKDLKLPVTKMSGVQVDAAREWVASDLAADVVGLLDSPATVRCGASPGGQDGGASPGGQDGGASPGGQDGGASPGGQRPIGPGDVAVLVRTNGQAALVHSALRAAGVPAVVAGNDSVFGTPSASHWLRLLESLEQPSSRARAAALALTAFVGMTAEDVASADEASWEDLHARLHRWAEALRRRGVATLARTVGSDQELPARLLAVTTGERQLTDLAHIAQLLHAEGSAAQMGPPALRAWLARRIEHVRNEDADTDERSRRLDSDADAVQVLTIHRAKGLQFPVVYCPFLWDAAKAPEKGIPAVFHDGSNGNQRTLDVGGGEGNPDLFQHLRAARAEQRGEDLRALYVALTRARHQAVVWWIRAGEAKNSALGRLLMWRDAGGDVPSDGKHLPKDDDIEARLHQLAARATGCIGVERAAPQAPASWGGPAEAVADLEAARFERRLDLAWRRTSYTGITAAAHGAAVGSEPEDPGITDEPPGADTAPPPGAGGVDEHGVDEHGVDEHRVDEHRVDEHRVDEHGVDEHGVDEHGAVDEGRLRGVLSLFAEVPGGAEVGTLVHRVMEGVDFAAGDLRAEVAGALAGAQGPRGLDLGPPGAVVDGLVAAISTPLGPLAGGKRLRDVARGDRLDELGFELPLAGGDKPTGEVLIGDVARLVASHAGSSGPLAGYAARLHSPALGNHLRGYLTGSIDVVVRLAAAGNPRFVVVDYKTNWLAPEGEALSTWHYRPAALDAEMQRAHYPLQALLYMVALHRYLRWRQPGYDPVRHLGGVLYLFVRGMVGAGAPAVGGEPCGVFSWPTPPGLVTALSDLLDGGSVRR